MAAAGDKSANLGAALRADLFAAAASTVGQVSFYEEEFSEEDVWGGAGEDADAATEAEDTREPPRGLGSADFVFSEATVTTGRVISRAGWDTAPSPLASLSKGRGGLSALAADGFTRSGQGPGPGPDTGGGAGDIIGPVPPLSKPMSSHMAGPLSGPMSGPSSGPGATTTASVFIPRLSARHDNLNSLNSRLQRRASAPVNVPDWSKVTGALASQGRENLSLEDDGDDNSEGGGNIMVPPHELVARECAKTVSFSVREGVGRTLRGRDLDHVRTAILRKTGFLDS